MKTLLPLLVFVTASSFLALDGWADDTKAPAKGGTFEVEVIPDIAYFDGKGADPAKHKLDLYLPKGQKDFPVLLYVHGGGWTKGDRKGAEQVSRTFAKHGIGTVTISYRLSPAVKHPAHVQDVAKAFAWTQRNIGKYGGRADQLFVSGHSAGGHLVALLASDESYLKAEKLALKDIKGAIPISGVFRIVPGRVKGAFGEDEEECRKASPLTHVAGSLPPFLVLYAEKDSDALRKQGEEMGEALKKAKIEAVCLEIKERDHGSIVRNIPNDSDITARAVLDFIARHSNLKGKDAPKQAP